MDRTEKTENSVRVDLLPQAGEGVVEQAVRLLNDFAGKELKRVEFLMIDRQDVKVERYLRAIVIINMMRPREEHSQGASKLWAVFRRGYFKYLEMNRELTVWEGREEEMFREMYWEDMEQAVGEEVDKAVVDVGAFGPYMPPGLNRARRDIWDSLFVVK